MAKEKTFKIITKKSKTYIEMLKIKYDAIYQPSPEKILKDIYENKPQAVEIYDITATKEAPYLSLIKVSDHINKTGENPIIGIQKFFKKDFYDIRNIYDDKNGKTTTSLGRHFKESSKEKNPSTHLCNIAILCSVTGIKKIKGVLVNIKKN